MNYTPIGRVRPIHRGAHDPSAAYGALDVVRREDGFASYMAKRDVPAGTPLADGEYWGLLSDVGLKAVADASCPAFEETGGTAVCHPVAGYPLEVVTEIVPKQSGAGEPSPDNVRPISGWTGAKLVRCGKNLCYKTTESGIYGVTFRYAGGNVILNGTSTNKLWLKVYNINLAAGETYTVSAAAELWIYVYSPTNGNIGQIVVGETSATFTASTTETHEVIIANAAGTVFNDFVANIQVETGSTATDYAPCQSDTYDAYFGQTVYGGTLDWNTGVLTVEWACRTITGDETNVTWNHPNGFSDGTWHSGSFDSWGIEPVTGYNTVADMICSHAPTKAPSNIAYTEYGVGYAENRNLYVNFGNQYNTQTLLTDFFKGQAAAGTPVQVAYRLAAPTVIQLTPEQIAALAGMNVLFSDCGGTRAAGRSDMTWVTKGILDRLAALEAAAVSD